MGECGDNQAHDEFPRLRTGGREGSKPLNLNNLDSEGMLLPNGYDVKQEKAGKEWPKS
jgi:hypothetical protein